MKLYIARSPRRFRGRCVFKPTCSIYSLGVFNKYGGIVGIYLTLLRLLRCAPQNRGQDPIPQKLSINIPKWFTYIF